MMSNNTIAGPSATHQNIMKLGSGKDSLADITAGTTMQSEGHTKHNSANRIGVNSPENDDRIALLNKANNGGRPQSRGMSAHPAPYRGNAAHSNGQAATANFFYGNTNATQ
jgi:hypothetical protein